MIFRLPCFKVAINLPYILVFGSHNCLKEFEVLNMSSMGFNTMNKMLNDLLTDITTKTSIVLKYRTHRLRF